VREEFGIATLTFHSDLRRRAASRRALPCPSSCLKWRESTVTTLTHCFVRVCITDSCRRDPRTSTTSLRTSRPQPHDSSPSQRFRPTTTPASSLSVDVLYHPGDADYPDTDDKQHIIHFDDDDNEDSDLEASGSPPSRARPGRGRPHTGSTSLTGSSILSDDVRVDRGRPPKVLPAPPVRTTSGGRGHQRHVVSVTSSSSASGSGVVRFPVVTSFLACALAAAAAAARFHRVTTTSTVY